MRALPFVTGGVGLAVGLAVGMFVSSGTETVDHDPPTRPSPVRSAEEPSPRSTRTVDITTCPDAEQMQALRDEVAKLKFEAALAKGQLAQAGGTSIPWPDEAPDFLREPSFSEDVTNLVGELGGAGVDAMLCEEFPCIAMIRAESEADADRYFDQGQEILEQQGVDAGVRTLQSEDGTWWVAFHGLSGDGLDVDVLAVNQRVEVRVFDHVSR